MTYKFKSYPIVTKADIKTTLDDIFVTELGYTLTDDQTSGSDRILNYDIDFDATKTYANCSLQFFLDDFSTYQEVDSTLMYNYNPVSHTAQYQSAQVLGRRIYTADTLKVYIFDEPQWKGCFYKNTSNTSHYDILGVFRPLGSTQDYFLDENSRMRLVITNYQFQTFQMIQGLINPTDSVYTNCYTSIPNFDSQQGINACLVDGLTLWAGPNSTAVREWLQQFDTNLAYSYPFEVPKRISRDSTGNVYRSFTEAAVSGSGFYIRIT